MQCVKRSNDASHGLPYDKCMAFLRKNTAQVHVYMQDLLHAVIQEEASYTTELLLSDIGGGSGLLLGMSFVTFVEILEVTATLLFVTLLHLTGWPFPRWSFPRRTEPTSTFTYSPRESDQTPTINYNPQNTEPSLEINNSPQKIEPSPTINYYDYNPAVEYGHY